MNGLDGLNLNEEPEEGNGEGLNTNRGGYDGVASEHLGNNNGQWTRVKIPPRLSKIHFSFLIPILR